MVKGCLSILKFSGKALCTPFLFLPFLARAQEPSELLPAPRTVVSGPAINVATTFRIANSVPAFNKQIDAFQLDCGGLKSNPSEVVNIVRDPKLAQEEYRLTLGRSIRLSASTPTGASWGLATLQQLRGRKVAIRLIDDRPEVPFRCVTLDVARRFHSIATLKTIARWCQAAKVRYLQLHLTDDQNWMFPTTVLKGADQGNASRRPAYTLPELRDLQAFASARGVTVIPEIDMPGHSTLAVRVNPSLFQIKGSASNNCLNFGSPEVRATLKQLLREVAEVFPSAPMIHFGGDEAWYPDAESDPQFKMAMSVLGNGSTPQDVFADFIGAMSEEVIRLGRTPMVWEGFASSPFARKRIPKQTVVVAWEGTYYPARKLTGDGFKVINAGWDPYYVVNHYPYDVDTLVPLEYLYHANYRHFAVVSGNASPDLAFDWAYPRQVLGSMLCWWEGYEWNALSTLPPRIAAMGARLWNPAGETDYKGFLHRLKQVASTVDKAAYPFEVKLLGARPQNPEQFLDAVRLKVVPRETGLRIAIRTDGAPPSLRDLAPDSGAVISKTSVVAIQAYRGNRPAGETRFVQLNRVTETPNLAMGRPVTTTAESDPQFPAQRVTDGVSDQLSSYWLAYPNPQFLTIDLGSVKAIDRIEVVACWASGAPTRYRLSVSRDGRAFQTVVDASTQSAPSTKEGYAHRIERTRARYVRIQTLGGGLFPPTMTRINQIRVVDDASN